MSSNVPSASASTMPVSATSTCLDSIPIHLTPTCSACPLVSNSTVAAASDPGAMPGMLVLGGCGYSVTSRTATRPALQRVISPEGCAMRRRRSSANSRARFDR